jgi:hypothetical protein
LMMLDARPPSASQSSKRESRRSGSRGIAATAAQPFSRRTTTQNQPGKGPVLSARVGSASSGVGGLHRRASSSSRRRRKESTAAQHSIKPSKARTQADSLHV